MKRIVLYPLVSLLSIGVSGVGSYLFRGLLTKDNNRNDATSETENVDSSIDEESDDVSYSEEEEPGFSKMINKLMSTKEVKAQDVTFTISAPEIDDVTLNFSSLDMDISGLLDGGNVSDLKLRGELSVEYKDLNTSVGLIVEDSFLYIDYDQHYFSFDAPSTIAGLLPVLNDLGISVPTVSTDGTSFDVSSILNNALSILEGVTENVTATGYEYTLDCDEFISSLNLPVSISGVKVILESDKDYNFIGGRTFGDGIKINSNYSIKLDVSGINALDQVSYQSLTEDEQERYENLTDRTTNLCTSIATLVKKQSFSAEYTASLETVDGSIQKQDVDGTIQADLNGIQKDVAKGKYEISINHSSMGKTLNSGYAAYKDNGVYLTVNNLIKGHVANSTIEDMIPLLSQELGDGSTEGISNEINSIIKGTDLEKLMAGDITAIKGFVNDFSTTENGFVLKVNAKAFGLGNYIITIGLEDVSASIENGFVLTVQDLCYNNYKVSLSLNVKPTNRVSFKYSDEEFANFKDYSGIVPIFKTITKLAKEKKTNATYSFDLINKKGESYLASGEISADISGLTTTGENAYYGDYRLTLNTTLNGYDHSLDFAYQNHDLYLTMDSFFKQKMSDTEVGAIYDVVNQDKENTSSAFDGMSNVLNAIIDEIKGTYSLKTLEDYVQIDNGNVDKDKLILNVDLAKFFTGTDYATKLSSLTLELDTNEDRITSVSVKNLSIADSCTLNFTLNFEDEFKDFKLSDEETSKYTEINSASKIVSGFYSLPTDLTQFSVNLSGTVAKEDDAGVAQNLISMNGDAQVDLTTKDSPDVGGTLNLIQPKDADYDKDTTHEVKFAYSGTKTNGQTIAEYTAKDDSIQTTGTTKLLMKNDDIFSIFDQVTALKDKKENLLYHYLKAYFDTAEKVTTGVPLMDAIQNKDYTILLNDYIKEVKVEDRTVTLVLNSSILDEEDTSGREDKIVVGFDENYKIKTAVIDGNYSGYEIHAEISLGDYDKSNAPSLTYSEDNKDDFVDMYGFNVLLNCFITTTEHHFFDMSGTLSIPIKVLSLNSASLSTYITAYITIVDSTVQAYISFNKNNNSYTDKNFYGVEFFVENELVYTARTTSNSSGKNQSVEIFKMNSEELLNNIVYYLLSYMLNVESLKIGLIGVGNIILGNVYGGMASQDSSSATMSRNYSSLIDKAVLEKTDGQGGKMNLTCSLGNLVSVSGIDLGSTNVVVNYNQAGELTYFNLQMSVTAYSVISATATFTVTRNNILDINSTDFKANEDALMKEKMKRYDAFVNAYNSDSELSSLGFYSIESITAKTHSLYKYSGVTVTDNGQKVTRSLTDSNKVFFYGNIA